MRLGIYSLTLMFLLTLGRIWSHKQSLFGQRTFWAKGLRGLFYWRGFGQVVFEMWAQLPVGFHYLGWINWTNFHHGVSSSNPFATSDRLVCPIYICDGRWLAYVNDFCWLWTGFLKIYPESSFFLKVNVTLPHENSWNPKALISLVPFIFFVSSAWMCPFNGWSHPCLAHLGCSCLLWLR